MSEPATIVVPNNIDVEQALLGAILINGEAFHRVSEFLSPEDFFEPVHSQVFETMGKLLRVGKAVTVASVKTFLPAEFIEGMTMAQYLARLATEATTVLNAYDYGRTIRDLAMRRSLYDIGRGIGDAALNSRVDEPAAAQIEIAERALYELSERGSSSAGFQPFSVIVKSAVDRAAAAYQRDGMLSGLATGLSDLDHLMGGLQQSDLVIIAARPAMGKTALATNIAFHVARTFRPEVLAGGTTAPADGGRVGFFSLEMSSEQLATRILAEQAGISSSFIRRGEIHENQFSRLVDVSNLMSAIPLYVDDTGGISIAQLVSKARRLKRQKGIDLIVVDYLQLLSAPNRRGDGRVQEVTEITTGLKALAKELDVPVIALSQLSRQVEAREDKHPLLSDLRESGSIEQDADVVLFLYREEYYLANKEPPEDKADEHLKWQTAMEKAHGRAEIIIGKQRHGPTGTVQVQFNSGLTKFSNLARADYLPERRE